MTFHLVKGLIEIIITLDQDPRLLADDFAHQAFIVQEVVRVINCLMWCEPTVERRRRFDMIMERIEECVPFGA